MNNKKKLKKTFTTLSPPEDRWDVKNCCLKILWNENAQKKETISIVINKKKIFKKNNMPQNFSPHPSSYFASSEKCFYSHPPHAQWTSHDILYWILRKEEYYGRGICQINFIWKVHSLGKASILRRGWTLSKINRKMINKMIKKISVQPLISSQNI